MRSCSLPSKLLKTFIIALALVWAVGAVLSPEDRDVLLSLSSSWPTLQSVTDPWSNSTVEDACDEWTGISCELDPLTGEDRVTALYVPSGTIF